MMFPRQLIARMTYASKVNNCSMNLIGILQLMNHKKSIGRLAGHILASLLILFILSVPSAGQTPTIIPAPVSARKTSGVFELSANTTVYMEGRQPEVKWVATYLREKISPATGFMLKETISKVAQSIQLIVNPQSDVRLGKEGYTLEVRTSNVTIRANSPAGLFYGVQTLLQLLPPQIESRRQAAGSWKIEGVEVIDYPRFAWRGVMLDVSRHFFSKAYVKEYIDQLACLKYNRFHLHLTDDHGWRVEIKSLPKLTSVGAWRVPRTGTFGRHEPPKPSEKPTNGGFYTHEDIREIVQYARKRFIEILPEVDVPGHSMAALAAYPELCVTGDTTITVNPGSNFLTRDGNGKVTLHIDNTLNPTDEKVYEFLDKVVGEIASLFPFEYIHMGGDECYKGYWERDPRVQAFMKKNSMRHVEELQSYFTRRVANIVASKKKKLIGWDEILEGGIPSDAAVMSWRGIKAGIEASHKKHAVVMSPAPQYYLDLMQGDVAIEAPVYSSARLKDVYNFPIFPTEIDTAYVLGGQGNLWTEQIATESQVEYMTYPRALAISETLWSPQAMKNWDYFVARIEQYFERFDAAGINYSTSMYDPIIRVKKDSQENLIIEMDTEVEGLDLHYTLDNSIPSRYHERYDGPITVAADVDFFKVVSYRRGERKGMLIVLDKEALEKRVRN